MTWRPFVVSLLLAVPVAAALVEPISLAGLPGNALVDPGFEQPGFSAWTVVGIPALLIMPGAAGTAQAALLANHGLGGSLTQPLSAAAGPATLLAFHARLLAAGEGRPAPNVVQLQGGSTTVVRVNFHGDQVALRVWATGTGEAVAAPTDGAWHQYAVSLAPAANVAVLAIDGRPVVVARGNASAFPAPDRIAIGDIASHDTISGAAPDVAYDEFYLGPS